MTFPFFLSLIGIYSSFAGALVINYIMSFATFKVFCQPLPTGDSVQCTKQKDGVKGFHIKWNDIDVICTAHTCPGYIGCEKCCDNLKSKKRSTSERRLTTNNPPLTKGKVILLSLLRHFSFHQSRISFGRKYLVLILYACTFSIRRFLKKFLNFPKMLNHSPFFYRRVIRLDELCQLNFCLSDSSSNKF